MSRIWIPLGRHQRVKALPVAAVGLDRAVVLGQPALVALVALVARVAQGVLPPDLTRSFQLPLT